jgi:uncharacterized protein YkwD
MVDINEVIRLSNEFRDENGKSALQPNHILFAVAQRQSDAMAANQDLSHTVIGKLGDRVTEAGYSWRRVEENIAEGPTDPASVMGLWENSDGHRKNLLNSEIQEVGAGYAEARDGTPYWTQVFAAPQ